MKQIKKLFQSFVLIVCASLYPVVFMYCTNVDEIQLGEVLPIAGCFAGVGLLIWLICLAIIRKKNKSAISATLLILLLSNYMLIQNAVNGLGINLKYWHLMPICVVVVLHIIYLICKKVKESMLQDVSLVLTLVMAGMLVMNIIPAVPQIIEKSGKETQGTQIQTNVTEEKQPNIYWMIFDECASFPVINEHYSFDSSEIYKTLQGMQFSISDDSFNESGNTISVLTNCLNLDYVVNSGMSAAELEKWRVDPELYRLLNEHGYSIYGIGDTEWLGSIQSLTTDVVKGAQTVEGFDVTQLILDQTVLAPFVQYSGMEAAQIILDAFAWFEDDKNFDPESSNFYLMYVCAPHQPFLFDENGGNVLSANYNNWEDPQYYLGQYKYVMKRIIASVQQIQKNDPNSIIMLMSDHGPRFKNGMSHQEKLNVLNCVYFCGEPFEKNVGKSGVNTLRLILNQLWNTEMEEVTVRDGD